MKTLAPGGELEEAQTHTVAGKVRVWRSFTCGRCVVSYDMACIGLGSRGASSTRDPYVPLRVAEEESWVLANGGAGSVDRILNLLVPGCPLRANYFRPVSPGPARRPRDPAAKRPRAGFLIEHKCACSLIHRCD
ncbi:hypothetical protein GGTG_13842 [Gaeumannomyces tritici R3-111a-1]|uniref:Uncharacterized protein n=1 Tax=Gaeumannomyces tritici (strain R3-111a-1) TaxID=644352 RepID=J3PJZ8_GAET3|nr:hypothetical protein GGTG_13842 [Gaeumannomyces tritici R3-111a-1]EJT68582.1 hypothetical protein GGTG_13842 [Gaeumannomyces tritici R3-111a-1]